MKTSMGSKFIEWNTTKTRLRRQDVNRTGIKSMWKNPKYAYLLSIFIFGIVFKAGRVYSNWLQLCRCWWLGSLAQLAPLSKNFLVPTWSSRYHNHYRTLFSTPRFWMYVHGMKIGPRPSPKACGPKYILASRSVRPAARAFGPFSIHSPKPGILVPCL